MAEIFIRNGREWTALTTVQRRDVLDRYFDTANIDADTEWDLLPYSIRHAIVWHAEFVKG